MKRTAFVTGGTGFVGTHLIKELLKRDFFLNLLVRDRNKAEKRFSSDKINILEGTIFDVEKFKDAIYSSSYIFHLAALTKALKKSEFFETNVNGTKKLVEIVSLKPENFERFVHISSLAAIGPSKSIDRMEFMGPVSTYGKSKIESEKIVREILAKNLFTIIRPPAVFGPLDMDVYKFFKSVNNGIVPLIGFNEKLASIIYVKDLANGIVDAALSENTRGKSYCLSYEKFFTWKELGQIAAKILGKKPVYIKIPHFFVLVSGFFNGIFTKLIGKRDIFDFDKAKEIIQKYWICDSTEAKKDFAFKCEYDVEKAFSETVEWYKNENLL